PARHCPVRRPVNPAVLCRRCLYRPPSGLQSPTPGPGYYSDDPERCVNAACGVPGVVGIGKKMARSLPESVTDFSAGCADIAARRGECRKSPIPPLGRRALISTLAGILFSHVADSTEFMRLHILGICGTFMGSLAQLAKQQGHRVSGSDAGVYPPMSDQLEAAGITLSE